MVGPIPLASIGSGSRSASSSILVSTIIIIALSHLCCFYRSYSALQYSSLSVLATGANLALQLAFSCDQFPLVACYVTGADGSTVILSCQLA